MFITRLLTALLILGAFLAALWFLPPIAWLGCLAPGLLLAAREWAALAGYGRAAAWSYAAVTVAAGIVLAVAPHRSLEVAPVHIGVYALAVAFWTLVAPLWLLGHWRAGGAGLAAVGWLVLVPTWLALVQLQAVAGALLIFMAIVWIADTAAYLVGRRWGRRKLAPTISPGKSWEGAAGAAVAVAMYYAAVQLLSSDPRPSYADAWGAFAFAALLVLSIEGDLFESWLKRQAGVKDSGSLLPGHGGVLDRIDGLTATLPAVALLLHYVG